MSEAAKNLATESTAVRGATSIDGAPGEALPSVHTEPATAEPPQFISTEELAGKQNQVAEIEAVIRAMSAAEAAPVGFFALKRAFDVVLAIVCLVVGMPLLVAITIAIRLESRGPVFFRQERVRQGLKRFQIVKFRTMHVEARPFPLAVFDAASGTYRRPRVHEDPRVTRVGRVLRRYSVDELPQIFNILAGEMSFIGPRPLSIPETLLVPQEALARYAVPSGISGLAQLRARSAIISHGRFDGDIEYVRNLSFWQELKIFFATFGQLYDRSI